MLSKLLALILAVLLMIPVAVSCSDSPPNVPVSDETLSNVTETESETETETKVTDDLPDVTYDGYEFVIYNANVLSNDWFITNYIDYEEDSADVLESAIYQRCRQVEDRFDIVLKEEIIETSVIKNACVAADYSFDLCLIKGSDSLSLAQDGYLLNQKLLDNIDFEKPYWDQNAVKELSIAGKIYHTAGDFITTQYDGVKVLFFNKGLIDSHNLTSPYEYVNNMTWTYDTMGELAHVVSNDINGDSVYDDNDCYGIMSYAGALYTTLILGSGEKFVTKDENDKPVMSFYSDRFVQVYEKIITLCNANGGTVTYNADSQNTKGLANNHRVQEIMFPNNQALFWIENIAWAKALRDMEMDFGIIPAPMLNSEQNHYYSYVGGNFFGTNIPLSTKDADRTSIILEALNSMSTGIITDAYYDVMLKSKLSRDEESGKMLDIIFNNLLYDIGVVYGVANVKDRISDMLSNSDMALSSFFTKNEVPMNKVINRAYDKIVGIDH